MRLALLVTAALTSSLPAFAQIPVTLPDEPEPAPPVAPASVADSASTPSAPAPAAPARVSPAQPAPAKAQHLTEQRADRAPAEANALDDDALDDDALDDSEPDGKPRPYWYGWQTLTADGISALVLVSAASLERGTSSLVWAGILGYEFAPGVLHFVHRNPGRAFASFGLRLGMPLAGAVIGGAFDNCRGSESECRADRAVAGFLVGMAGAIALDAAVFAYDKPAARKRSALLPLVSVTPGRAWVGFGGEL